MPYWHLCAPNERLHTDGMQLPQSSSLCLFLRLVSIALLGTLAAGAPLSAKAGTQPLVCSPTSLRFGTVPVGQSETQLTVLTNTGQTSATISAIRMSGSEFTVSGLTLPAVLAAGQSVVLNVAFAPTANGWTRSAATFTITSNSNLQLPFAGTGVTSDSLTAAPSSLSFGQVAVGASVTLPVVLTNARTWNQTLKAFQVGGTGFSVSGPSFPLTLSAGQSVKLSVSFTPQAAAVSGGSVFISGPALNIPLTGTGTVSKIGQLTISPSTLNFGSVLIDETGTQAATLSATGASVTVSSAASSSAQFSLPGATFPVTIGAGQTVQLNVSFTPKSVGTASATLSFASNASDSQASESLAGTGTAPAVSLTWLPSTSQVSGYNVYRGTKPGAYSKINTTLDPTTAYTDSRVASRTTYYYAATAVDSSGQESTYSSAIEVVVP